jgi:hypothetical protein
LLLTGLAEILGVRGTLDRPLLYFAGAIAVEFTLEGVKVRMASVKWLA